MEMEWEYLYLRNIGVGRWLLRLPFMMRDQELEYSVFVCCEGGSGDEKDGIYRRCIVG